MCIFVCSSCGQSLQFCIRSYWHFILNGFRPLCRFYENSFRVLTEMVELILLHLGVGSGVLFLLFTCTQNCECCNEYLASQSRTLTRQNSGVVLARSVKLCVMMSIAAVCAKCLHTSFSGLDLYFRVMGMLEGKQQTMFTWLFSY